MAEDLLLDRPARGIILKRLFERWNIAELIADRTVEAKPGVPAGSNWWLAEKPILVSNS